MRKIPNKTFFRLKNNLTNALVNFLPEKFVFFSKTLFFLKAGFFANLGKARKLTRGQHLQWLHLSSRSYYFSAVLSLNIEAVSLQHLSLNQIPKFLFPAYF